MRKLNTREYVLLGLLATAAIGMLYFNRDARLGGAGLADGGLDDERFDPAPIVQLDRLATGESDYDANGRNLFQYYTPPPPKVDRPVRPPTRVTPVKPIATPPPRQVKPKVVDSAPKPPPITFAYLGFLGPKSAKIAVFEDGQELVVARAGDVVKNQFRVIEFGYETVRMGYTDDRFKDQTTELRQRPASGGGGRRRGR